MAFRIGITYFIFDCPLVVDLSLAALKPLWKLLHLKKKNMNLCYTKLKGCYKIFKSVITSFGTVVDFMKRKQIEEHFEQKIKKK